MRSARIITTLALLIGSGCGGKNSFHGRERTNAPIGKGDVGILVEDASEDEIAKILDQNPGAQVRVLNQTHGLYEIFGVELAEVASSTKGRAEKNEFFELIAPKTGGLLSVPAPTGLEIRGLEPCKGGLPAPVAVLNVTEPSRSLNGATIQLGSQVKLNSLASHAAAATPSVLKTAFVVEAPAASPQGSKILLQNELEFTPDAMGVYSVAIVVQDPAGACAMDGAVFIVTANRPYDPASAKDLNVNTTKMRHLAAVQAEESWELSQGEGVTIAVIDSGVNYNHPALASQMAVNAGEIPGNGIDDDHDGFVDDVVGFDFVNNDGFPYDDMGHGSHVAGLAAAKPFGLAKRAKILAVKALTGIGGDVGTIAAALRYSVDRGAKIVNMSLGAPAPLPHPAIVAAMAYAESKGVLVVASAGNGDPQTGLGFSIDEIPFFPAGLPNANILSVASFDSGNVMSIYSNFGKKNVDVVAPGGDMPADPMYSCAYENPKQGLFEAMSGTSMAAPVVSGIAAQVLSAQPRLTVAELKDLLMKAGDSNPELAEVSGSGRHINAFKAVEAAYARNVLF